MSDYGFDFNASAVYNENGKVSVGVNFKDSDGFKFDTTEEGSIKEVTDALYKKFAKEYAAEVARLQKAAEKKAKEKEKPEDMVARLRRLEKENAKLRAEIEKKNAANAKTVQERAAKASAKYKDPNYNKPGDDKAKTALKKADIDPSCYISVKPSTRKAVQKFVSSDHEALLRELFSNRDDIFDFWNSMGWPW